MTLKRIKYIKRPAEDNKLCSVLIRLLESAPRHNVLSVLDLSAVRAIDPVVNSRLQRVGQQLHSQQLFVSRRSRTRKRICRRRGVPGVVRSSGRQTTNGVTMTFEIQISTVTAAVEAWVGGRVDFAQP